MDGEVQIEEVNVAVDIVDSDDSDELRYINIPSMFNAPIYTHRWALLHLQTRTHTYTYVHIYTHQRSVCMLLICCQLTKTTVHIRKIPFSRQLYGFSTIQFVDQTVRREFSGQEQCCAIKPKGQKNLPQERFIFYLNHRDYSQWCSANQRSVVSHFPFNHSL